MKIISEITGKNYPSVEACLEAEKKYTEEQERLRKAKEVAAKKEQADREAKEKARAARAKAVEKAYSDMQQAQSNYNQLLKEFLRDYGSFHFTVSNSNNIPSLLMDWMNIL